MVGLASLALSLFVGLPPKSDHGFELANSAISESSGIAPSRRHRGIYWTHNDSGDGPNLYAFDLSGKDRGTLTLQGAKAFDWEDIASARIGDKAYLYVGDIGDNAKQRKIVRIYRVPEPSRLGGTQVIQKYEQYICSYPDGAHDCEALMVTSQGDLQLVTKDDFGNSGIYVLKKPTKAGEYKLRKIGSITLSEGSVYSHLVTGGDMAPDGRVAVRTYFTAMLYPKGDSATWFKRKPSNVEIALERQGEAICFDPWANRLITTSERSPCRVSFARLPQIILLRRERYRLRDSRRES